MPGLIFATDRTLSVGLVGVIKTLALSLIFVLGIVIAVELAGSVAVPIEAPFTAPTSGERASDGTELTPEEVAIGVLEIVSLLVLTSVAMILPWVVMFPAGSMVTFPLKMSTPEASKPFCKYRVPRTLISLPFSIESVPSIDKVPAILVSARVVLPKDLKLFETDRSYAANWPDILASDLTVRLVNTAEPVFSRMSGGVRFKSEVVGCRL